VATRGGQGKQLLRVVGVEAYVLPSNPATPVILLRLEEGRELTLYYVPFEVVDAINSLERGGLSETGSLGLARESVFHFLATHEDIRNLVSQDLEKVVIDELDVNTGLFTAKVFFTDGKNRLVRRMVPSHAVFLAYMTGKPIYVERRLVEYQKL